MVYFILGLLSLFISLSCNSFTNVVKGIDSSVFQYVAMEIGNGAMPYLDTFDHKGLLIYFIDLFGNSLSDNFGIWLIEFLTFFLSFVLMYKTARYFCDKLVSVLAVSLTLPMLTQFLEGGNFVEEYAILFISGAVLIFTEYFINHEIKWYKIVLCGVCFACIILLRPNMIGIWLAGCLLILIDCIRNKEIFNLFKYILFFILGISVCLVPCIIWLWINGALKACIDTYILFNIEYSGALNSFGEYFKTLYDNVFQYSIFFVSAASIYIVYKRRDMVSLFGLLGFMLSLIMAVKSRVIYAHYLLILIPAAIVPFSFLFSEIEKRFDADRFLSVALIVSIVLAFLRPTIKIVKEDLIAVSGFRNYVSDRIEKDHITQRIIELTDEGDEISCYGNCNKYYLTSNRMSVSKYSYQYPIAEIDSMIRKEYFSELKENKPKLIVWCDFEENDNCYRDEMYRFVIENGYIQEGNIFYLK